MLYSHLIPDVLLGVDGQRAEHGQDSCGALRQAVVAVGGGKAQHAGRAGGWERVLGGP